MEETSGGKGSAEDCHGVSQHRHGDAQEPGEARQGREQGARQQSHTAAGTCHGQCDHREWIEGRQRSLGIRDQSLLS